jgi:predicted neuraminidase
MTDIQKLIQELRKRPDVGVADEAQSWRICITKGCDLLCQVTVPHDVLEGHAAVWHRREKKDVWTDWMDYSGYDSKPRATLEAEMASDILAFVNRASTKEPLLPLKIYED